LVERLSTRITRLRFLPDPNGAAHRLARGGKIFPLLPILGLEEPAEYDDQEQVPCKKRQQGSREIVAQEIEI